jgi:hypothetical protein
MFTTRRSLRAERPRPPVTGGAVPVPAIVKESTPGGGGVEGRTRVEARRTPTARPMVVLVVTTVGHFAWAGQVAQQAAALARALVAGRGVQLATAGQLVKHCGGVRCTRRRATAEHRPRSLSAARPRHRHPHTLMMQACGLSVLPTTGDHGVSAGESASSSDVSPGRGNGRSARRLGYPVYRARLITWPRLPGRRGDPAPSGHPSPGVPSTVENVEISDSPTTGDLVKTGP